MKSKNGDLVNQIQVEGFSDLSQLDQTNTINLAFMEPLEEYRLPSALPRFPLEESPDIPHITESRVAKVLAKLSPSKASGPDQIPNWLLKEYSDFVAFPVTEILSASFNEQCLPSMWKTADVTPCQRRNQCSF